MTLRYSAGLEKFNAAQKKLTDVDGDGKITSSDSLFILRYSVKLTDKNVTVGKQITIK